MAEALFRFMVLRPPLAQDPKKGGPLALAQDSTFQVSITTAASSQKPRAELYRVAKEFVASDKFVKTPAGNKFQSKLNQFSSKVDQIERSFKPLTGSDIKIVTEQVFGVKPSEFVKSEDFKTLATNLRDSITAVKFIQEEHARPIEALANQLRDLELIEKAAQQPTHDVNQPDPPQQQILHEAEPDPFQQQNLQSSSSASSLPNWTTEKDYKVKDGVVYNDLSYECLQAHHSLSTWIPPDAPSLWKRTNVEPGSQEPEPKIELDFAAFRKRSLLLPFDVDLKPVIASSADEQKMADDVKKEEAKKAEEEAAKLLKTYAQVKASIDELMKIGPEHFQAQEVVGGDGSDVESQYTRTEVLKSQLEYRSSLRHVALRRSDSVSNRPPAAPASAAGDADTNPTDTQTSENPSPLAEPTGAFGLAKDLLSTAGLLQPKGGWKPLPAAERTPRLKSGSLGSLSEQTQNVLKERNLDILAIPVNYVVDKLKKELESGEESLRNLAPVSDNVTFTRVGNSFIATRVPIQSLVTEFLYGGKSSIAKSLLPILPLDGRIPHTKGKVSPAGVADLLVVKQTLKGYQGAEIAHVENVLKGQSSHRSYQKTTRSESTITDETETNKSEENELSSTSRFEMSKESSNTLKEDQELKGSLKVSAKYGPAVSIDASAEGSMSRNKEEINKTASKFGQDVTQRATKKIADRVLQKKSTTTVSEIIEKSDHGLDNAGGSGHISGVYQWLNKVYEAQVFNYGLRMMFEFMVPEPAAFLTEISSDTSNTAEAQLVHEKPMAFTMAPRDINSTRIDTWINRYQATDVLPPPEDYITISDHAKFGGGDANTNYDHSALLTIPSGYEAFWAVGTVVYNIWEKANATVDYTVSSEYYRFSGCGSWATSVANHNRKDTGGIIPWGFNTWGISDGVATVEVMCRVTARRIQQWQAETHAKLLTAYKARVDEYEAKLAKLKLQSGITIEGTNPTANLNTIKTELKKNCISILTAQHFDLFNSISSHPRYGFLQVNLYEAEAEGRYVRFFEQAFEWDQIMYITYPYFWGRMNTWKQKHRMNDPDPVFDEFLKSGFARVAVPARPGFEGAIDHFMQFGEIWNGGTLPTVSSILYVPISDEIAERTGKPLGEVPQGEPWDVVLPTTLVKLRADDKLPIWKKDDAGKWTSVAE